MTFKSEDVQQVCHCHTTEGELSLKDTVRKQAGTIYTATHMSRHLSKQKVLNPALACWSFPDIWLITVRPLQQRKTADEKSESLQAQPVPTATCVLTCKILSPYVPPTYPPPSLSCSGPIRADKVKHLPCRVRAPQVGPRAQVDNITVTIDCVWVSAKTLFIAAAKQSAASSMITAPSCSLQINLWKLFGLARIHTRSSFFSF